MRALALTALLLLSPEGQRAPEIRLVLQITVDGLRGDLLNRYRSGFGEGGFENLLARGAVFTNAHYLHANTETIVGHTTLATGSHPRDHGMVGNLWFDRESGHPTYNVEDAEYPLLQTRPGKGAQLDMTQKAARTDGRSPRAIRGSTFSDELFNHTAGKAKIFAVSAKDRGAIPLAGRWGKAFWYSVKNGDYVTSRYYYDDYPEWAKAWNANRPALQSAGKSWELLADAETYLLKDQDDRPFEMDLKGYGRTFPHPFGSAKEPIFFSLVYASPVSDRLTADFAKQILVHEKLGKDAVPDYLSVSFSSVDIVNHFFGPSSLENEDCVRRLDRTLADFLAAVDELVGLEHTLIVLCADHGMPEAPEQVAGHGAGRLDPARVKAVADRAAEEKFGVQGLVRACIRPYLYLDRALLKKHALDGDEVARALATAVQGIDGVAMAIPRAEQELLRDDGPRGRIQRNFDPNRSGDIYVVQEPYWYFYSPGALAVMHGSPWRYDTFVPLVFAGPDVRAGRRSRLAHPSDIAPTLSALLGINPPAMARGNPLPMD